MIRRLGLILAFTAALAAAASAQTRGIAYRFRGGSFANRPGPCTASTPTDIYYAIDTDVLYVCVTTNTWGTLATALTALADSATAPTVTGFGTSPSVVASNGTIAFSINVGTGGLASTGTINLPTATTGWVCNVYDVTNPASFVTNMTGGTATTVTLQNYSRTSGLAIAWTASDILRCSCRAF